MKRIDVTYGQLDQVLRALGFSYRVLDKDPPTRVYEHQGSGALITIPALPETDRVLDRHLVAARTILDLFGVAPPTVFDAKLRKAG